MKIYRIYKTDGYWDYSDNDYDTEYITEDITIKYVDSIDKVNTFLKNIKDKNIVANKCYHCPLIKLTKRRYTNGKHNEMINTYCENKDIYFTGNFVFCRNENKMDFTDYGYEEIEVE